MQKIAAGDKPHQRKPEDGGIQQSEQNTGGEIKV